MLVIKKSWNWLEYVPSKPKPSSMAADWREVVGVFPGLGLEPPLVPSHLCVPPDGVVTSEGPDTIQSSKMVPSLSLPSRRRRAFVSPGGAAEVQEMTPFLSTVVGESTPQEFCPRYE